MKTIYAIRAMNSSPIRATNSSLAITNSSLAIFAKMEFVTHFANY